MLLSTKPRNFCPNNRCFTAANPNDGGDRGDRCPSNLSCTTATLDTSP
jgi:hypothetical protein